MDHQVKVSYWYTEDDMKNILSKCLEFSEYWARLLKTDIWDNQPEDMSDADYAYRLLVDGEDIWFIDEMNNDDERSMNLSDFYTGIGKALRWHDWSGVMDNLGSIAADSIMQYTLLGTVEY